MPDEPVEPGAETDLAKVLEEIKAEVSARRSVPGAFSLSGGKMKFPPIMPDKFQDISLMKTLLLTAERFSDVGTQVTPMAKFGWFTRKIALLVGKTIIFLSSFITDKQRAFNGMMVQMMQKVVEGLESRDMRISRHMAVLSEHIAVMSEHMAGMSTQIEDLRVAADKLLENMQSGLAMQERRIALLMEEIEKKAGQPILSEQGMARLHEERTHFLDALYVFFEDEFRGSEASVKERLSVYLPLLKDAAVGTEAMPILDLGCGRGEWLDILREEGMPSRGIEMNRVFVSKAKERGLDVVESDIFAYLRGLPEASVGGVTAFHVVEHLVVDRIVVLIDEIVRVLKPGGIVIIETPNPGNVLVGSHHFYIDPTHVRPLPGLTLQFLAKSRGLRDVRIMELHPYPEEFKLNGSPLAERFNEYFYGPQDYAVIGRKG